MIARSKFGMPAHARYHSPEKSFLRSMYHFVFFNVFYRSALKRRTTTSLNGFRLVIDQSVLHPRIFKSGKAFAEFLATIDLKGKSVLDMGTGSGILALTASAQGAEVTASDVSPVAVQCARENFQNNGFGDTITTKEGHLFEPLTHRAFDVIVFNPPYFTGKPGTHSIALYGGDRLALLSEFASSARAHLTPQGYILLIVSSDSDIDLVLHIFRQQNYEYRLMNSVRKPFEEFYVFKFIPDTRPDDDIKLVCPSCRGNLHRMTDGWSCVDEGLTFGFDNGIPDFVIPSRREIVNRFLEIYHAVRKYEVWGNDDPNYYFSLPHIDTSGRHKEIWKTRSKSFDTFLRDINQDHGETKTILDVGAGNSWMSNRLAQEGFNVTAVDLSADPYDGLGTAQRIRKNGRPEFTCIRAEFDSLPFQPESFDLIVFNASLHYSNDPYTTLMNAEQFLKAGGTIYVLDSPIYQNESSGYAMIRERSEDVKRRFNLDIPVEFSGGFLTYHMVRQLADKFAIEFITPNYGLRWRARQFASFLFHKREPASFEVIKLTKR